MAQVTVTIDGKAYRMACEEGQEEHLISLADNFDRYVSHLKGQFGEIGDLRLTVMASIMVMDELTEATRRAKALEVEVEKLRKARDSVVDVTEKSDAMVVTAISELSEQVRVIAAKLNGNSAGN
jgi:cell division protein ZapA